MIADEVEKSKSHFILSQIFLEVLLFVQPHVSINMLLFVTQKTVLAVIAFLGLFCFSHVRFSQGTP